MIKGKIELLTSDTGVDIKKKVNAFLETIDIRQIVKMEYSSSYGQSSNLHTCMILYVNFEDIRDAKLDTVFAKNEH